MSSRQPVSQDTLDRIRAAISLPAYLAERHPELGLRRAGRDYRGRCPFEPGSTDATKFSVSDERYHCFACGRSGSIYSWLEHAEDLSFREAVEAAARIADIELPKTSMSRAQAAAAQSSEAARIFLTALADWSVAAARALPESLRRLELPHSSVPLDRLIDSGEVGWIAPDNALGRLAREQRATGDTLKALGLDATSAAALSGQWVLWARDRRGPIAARVIDAGAVSPAAVAVIGMAGPHSAGWVTPPAVKGIRMDRAAIASTDALYCELRANRLGEIVRPIGASAFQGRLPAWLRRGTGDDLRVEESPILLSDHTTESRRAAAVLAKAILPFCPRLRVVETDRPGESSSAREWVLQFRNALDAAGTVIDWQLRLATEAGHLETPSSRERVAARLAPYIDLVSSPFEHAVFSAEMTAFTGVSIESARALASPLPPPSNSALTPASGTMVPDAPPRRTTIRARASV